MPTLEDHLREKKVMAAVELYLQRFDTSKGVTVSEAAEKFGVTGTEVHLYLANHVGEGLGMPSNKQDARKYLDRFKEIKAASSVLTTAR